MNMQQSFGQVSYKIRQNLGVVYDSSMPMWVSLLQDGWEEFREEDLEPYFNASYEKFADALSRFRTLARSLTPQEEHNLKFMLDSLIHTKNTIYLNK